MAIDKTLIAQRALMDQIDRELHERLAAFGDRRCIALHDLLQGSPEMLRRASPRLLAIVAKLATHTLVSRFLADLEREFEEGQTSRGA